jgi:hypothetical protein
MIIDDDKLETAVRDIIIDICEVMYKRGYDAVPIGAMMRLVGVDSERAVKHDNEYLALDTEFQAMLESRNLPDSAPKGATLH